MSDIEHPSHYQSEGVECIDAMYAVSPDMAVYFSVGSALKYLDRAGLKGEAEMIQDTDEFVPGKIAVTAYIVKCSKCWAAPLPNNYEGKKEAAAARWNRRIEACG